MNLETPAACLDGRGAASAHLEKYSVSVTIYLLPLVVSGSGPIKSIPIWWNNLDLTGMGWSVPTDLFSLFWRWQRSHDST